MQPAGFGYVPAPYSPSVPSSMARFGRPDVSFPGGIGDLDYGRIPVSGGGHRKTSRKTSRKAIRKAIRKAHRKTRVSRHMTRNHKSKRRMTRRHTSRRH